MMNNSVLKLACWSFMLRYSIREVQSFLTVSTSSSSPSSWSKVYYINEDQSTIEASTFSIDTNSKKVVTLHHKSKFDETWSEQYSKLLKYYRIHGHSNVPCNYSDRKLSRWVTNQRQHYKLQKKAMTQERIDALNQLNFSWILMKSTSSSSSSTSSSSTSLSHEENWMNQYTKLKQYYDTLGHCIVPNKHPLYRWLDTQRVSHRRKLLSETKVSLLNEIEFDWNPAERKWNMYFEQLKELYQQEQKQLDEENDNNDSNNNHSSNSNHYSPLMTKWINSQRHQYTLWKNGKKTTLTTIRYDKLNSIGFDWNTSPTDTSINTQLSRSELWQAMFNELVQYRKEKGDCLVPQHYQENPKLGQFVKYQRKQYKQYYIKGLKSSMTHERVQLLESIGFVWNCSNNDMKLSQIRIRDITKNRNSIYTNNSLEQVRSPLKLVLQTNIPRSMVDPTKRKPLTNHDDDDYDSKLLLLQYQKKALWGLHP